jgi:tight adherence protein C
MSGALVLGFMLFGGIGLAIKSLRQFQPLSLVNRLSTSTPSRRLVSGYYGIEAFDLAKFRFKMLFASRRKMQTALFELPDILDLLAVSLSAGDGLYAALSRVAPRASGQVAGQLQEALVSLNFGSTLEVEMALLAERIPHRQVAEFASKVTLALQRGSPLAQLLREQAASARSEIQVQLLKKSGQNETRMMIPLVFLILPVTVLFAVYPSLQLLNLNYF